MKRVVAVALASGMLLAISARDARAQMSPGTFRGYLTGHVGSVFGGEVDSGNFSGGGSVSVQESDGWGAEIDFGHSSDAVAGNQVVDVTSYMVNAAWIKPVGWIRPFATIGAGILQVNGCTSPCPESARTNDLGITAGGGAFLLINDIVGLRADARYFFAGADHSNLGRPENMSYWRVTVGATFMWAILP